MANLFFHVQRTLFFHKEKYYSKDDKGKDSIYGEHCLGSEILRNPASRVSRDDRRYIHRCPLHGLEPASKVVRLALFYHEGIAYNIHECVCCRISDPKQCSP